jgi:ABC-type Na+ transport system ATPase subunit NatA
VSGGVLFNGAPMTKRAKRSLGFVLQDDLLYEALTVQETLYYAAMLRLPRSMSTAQKKERVGEVIAALGLAKCRDTIIGGFFRRGISGGERKRVSVGHELLINPSVLLLDEPTSGLDSTTAMRLVTTLRSLAAGGRAVATTIHQPSSRLFQLLDKLLLLSEGHAIYYGRAALATDWFHRLGFTMPYGVNAADFLLDVASGDVSGATDGNGGGNAGSPPTSKPLSGEPARRHLIDVYERFSALHGGEHDGFSQSVCLSAAVVGPDAWAAMQARRSLSETLPADVFGGGGGTNASPANGSPGSKGLPPSAHAGALPPTDGPPAATNGTAALTTLSSAAVTKADRWGASYGTQLSILFARAVKTRRFEAMSGQDFAQFIVVGLLSGLFWWQIGRDRTVSAAANINGLLFFEMLFLSFRSMFAALFTFPNEHKMMLKERASGMYRLSAFYFARTASDVPMEVTIPTVFIVIIYFMAGLRLSVWAFLANWAAVTLCLLVAQSFGLLIGATVMVPKTAQTITAIIMLTMMLVGGFYVTTIPAWIAWLKYASFVYYGYNLLLKINWVGVPLWDCGGTNPPSPATDPACTPVPPGGLQAKLHLQENTERWPWEALALLAWLVIFRAAVYVALRRKTGARAR